MVPPTVWNNPSYQVKMSCSLILIWGACTVVPSHFLPFMAIWIYGYSSGSIQILLLKHNQCFRDILGHPIKGEWTLVILVKNTLFGRAFLVYTGEHSTSISYCEMGGHWLFCFWLNCAILFSAPIQPWCHESIAAEKVCKLYCMRVVVLLKRLNKKWRAVLFSNVRRTRLVSSSITIPYTSIYIQLQD